MGIIPLPVISYSTSSIVGQAIDLVVGAVGAAAAHGCYGKNEGTGKRLWQAPMGHRFPR
jgi:hypothetical protein